ncbi:histidine kinase [Paenibacillus sp. FSL R10-2734]|uniref:sensor histidine kinase n=1 Tax=Paenibacillus sp. FSL R10-2734 TaxID=2954691 RepID=UPI0030DC031C
MRIKTQIGIAVACFLVIMLIIIYSMYVQTSNIVIQNNKKFTADIVTKFQQDISESYNEMNQMMISLAFDPTIQEFMMQTDADAAYPMTKDLDRKIVSLKAGRSGVEDIVIIGYAGAKYSLNGGINTIQQYEQDILHSDEIYVSGLQNISYQASDIKGIFFAQQVISTNSSDGTMGSSIGYIAVIVNVGGLYFNQDREQSSSGVQFYMIDDKSKVYPEIYAQDISLILSQWKPGEQYDEDHMFTIGKVKGSVLIEPAKPLRGSILALIPNESLLQELAVIRLRIMMIVFVVLLLMVLPFVVIVSGVIQPMQKLVKFMKSIKRGNLNNLESKLELKGSIEMKIVADELNAMLSEINTLTQQLVSTTTNLLAAEIEKEKAASAYLRSQINPHFLNNTLESIRGIAQEEESHRIVAMTKALGKLFHYSIRGTGYVALEQELAAVKSYVYLQLVRFEDRFSVEYHFTEEALKVPVMKMILQPLVENAIYHGLEPKLHKGKLIVAAEIEEDQTLVITIEDDGIGVASERVAEIQQKLNEFTSRISHEGRYLKETDSIGLFNVHNRIRLAYGDRYGLCFDSTLDVGTRIQIRMPVHHDMP